MAAGKSLAGSAAAAGGLGPSGSAGGSRDRPQLCAGGSVRRPNSAKDTGSIRASSMRRSMRCTICRVPCNGIRCSCCSAHLLRHLGALRCGTAVACALRSSRTAARFCCPLHADRQHRRSAAFGSQRTPYGATRRGQLEALFGALVLTVTAYGQSESHCGRCSGRAEGSDQPERPIWRNGLADGRCRRRTGTYMHAFTFSQSCMRQPTRLQASTICKCCLATAHCCHTTHSWHATAALSVGVPYREGLSSDGIGCD